MLALVNERQRVEASDRVPILTFDLVLHHRALPNAYVDVGARVSRVDRTVRAFLELGRAAKMLDHALEIDVPRAPPPRCASCPAAAAACTGPPGAAAPRGCAAALRSSRRWTWVSGAAASLLVNKTGLGPLRIFKNALSEDAPRRGTRIGRPRNLGRALAGGLPAWCVVRVKRSRGERPERSTFREYVLKTNKQHRFEYATGTRDAIWACVNSTQMYEYVRPSQVGATYTRILK